MINIISNIFSLSELFKKVINVKEMKDFSKAYSNFLSEKPSITLIHFPIMMRKTKDLRKYLNFLSKNKVKLLYIIWISYQKTLNNKL